MNRNCCCRHQSSHSSPVTFDPFPRLACLPKRMECTAGEDKYDLRTLAESNTKVDLHRVEGNSSLVISLCGPVNLTSDSSLSRCPFGTAACWYNNSAAISLGEVDRGFAPFSDFIDGLELRYIGGSPCHTGGPPSQLLITLVCSEGAEVCMYVCMYVRMCIHAYVLGILCSQ